MLSLIAGCIEGLHIKGLNPFLAWLREAEPLHLKPSEGWMPLRARPKPRAEQSPADSIRLRATCPGTPGSVSGAAGGWLGR